MAPRKPSAVAKPAKTTRQTKKPFDSYEDETKDENKEADREKDGDEEESDSSTSESDRYDTKIMDRPLDERPRERLLRSGPQALNTAELLAILMRTGSSERSVLGLAEHLIHSFHGLRGVANASIEELQTIKGVGSVKAIEIMAAVEMGKRLSVLSVESRMCIRSPQDVSNLLMAEMRDLKKEHLKSILLDTKNRVLRAVTVSVGILDSSLVHPREVFKDAILASAASIIVAHNHPSGDPTPSQEDINVTKRLLEAGKIMGIELLDHIIIGDNRWVSLKERGHL